MKYLAAALLAFAGTTHAACDTKPDLAHLYTAGWGIDVANTRFQPDTTITAANALRLELAWAFGLGDSSSPHAYPLVTTDTVFIGDEDGMLHALDKRTGCIRWRFEADEDIRTAIVPGRVTIAGMDIQALYFGTRSGAVYAVDASDGRVLWQVEADPHPFAIVTGSPVFFGGRLYVPVSSFEVIVAAAPVYPCCSFRGSVLALDAANGTALWRHYTVDEPAAVTGKRLLIDKRGPSGAPVWLAPTVNAERGLLYFGTGENYSEPATDTSDAIFAVALADGAMRWRRQFTTNDAWNAACGMPLVNGNCPNSQGPDFDFGAPPILTRDDAGRAYLLAGQKSGMVYALDPDDGKVLWEKRAGGGGKLGGIHWGMAVNERLGLVFVPVSDRGAGSDDTTGATPGLYALDIATGETRWADERPARCADRKGCFPGFSAAVLATDELLFAASLDGVMHVYRADNGDELWQHDTWRDFVSVNEIDTKGGAIDVHGPLVAGDMLFVTSGYRSFGQQAGNAFLAYVLR